MACGQTVEDDCIRLGLFERWHPKCVRCAECDTSAAVVVEEPPQQEEGMPKPFVRKLPPKADEFVFEARTMVSINAVEVTTILCVPHRTNRSRPGFEPVTRLEQYAYLLNVALRRLCEKLQIQGVVATMLDTVGTADHPHPLYDAYRDSSDIKRLKSVNLDRKISAHARMPQRSTVVESPSGKTARPGGLSSTRSNEGLPPLPIDGRAGSPVDTASRSIIPVVRTPSNDSPNNDEQGSMTPSGKIDVIRPAFARNNTSVCIVNENPEDGVGANESNPPVHDDSPFEHEDGVTLADIPAIVEAEQARLSRRNTTLGDGRPLISELAPLDALIVKHFALLALTKSSLAPYIDMEDMLELVEVRKNQWWNKIFKGGKDKKDIKRKGQFVTRSIRSRRLIVLSRRLRGTP